MCRRTTQTYVTTYNDTDYFARRTLCSCVCIMCSVSSRVDAVVLRFRTQGVYLGAFILESL